MCIRDRTDDGDVFLNAGNIRSVSIKDMKTTLSKSMKTTRRAKRLIFKFPEGEKKQTVSLMYFRPGIRWIPTYRIGLGKKDGKNTVSYTHLRAHETPEHLV